MADAYVKVRLGEIVPIVWEIDAPLGNNFTIQGTPKVTLKDAQNLYVVAGGLDGTVSVTAFNSAKMQKPQALYLFNPSLPPSGVALAPGFYSAICKIVALDDGTLPLTRTYEPVDQVGVIPDYY